MFWKMAVLGYFFKNLFHARSSLLDVINGLCVERDNPHVTGWVEIHYEFYTFTVFFEKGFDCFCFRLGKRTITSVALAAHIFAFVEFITSFINLIGNLCRLDLNKAACAPVNPIIPIEINPLVSQFARFPSFCRIHSFWICIFSLVDQSASFLKNIFDFGNSINVHNRNYVVSILLQEILPKGVLVDITLVNQIQSLVKSHLDRNKLTAMMSAGNHYPWALSCLW
jgi:hypothetical protein